jgi:hypothetical protein
MTDHPDGAIQTVQRVWCCTLPAGSVTVREVA